MADPRRRGSGIGCRHRSYSAPGVMRMFIVVVEPDRTRQEFQFTDVLGDA